MQKAVALYLRLSQEDVDVRRNAAKDESNSISGPTQACYKAH